MPDESQELQGDQPKADVSGDRGHRGCLHALAFWAAGIGSVVVNGLVLTWWLRKGGPPPARLLNGVVIATGLAAFVFYASAAALVRTATYRPNLRCHWALLAGACYGIGFVWPIVGLALWDIRRAPAASNSDPPSWAVWSLVAWVLLVLPALLGRLFARRLREIKPGSGLCARCGYDLRASAGRCPECGTPAPSARSM